MDRTVTFRERLAGKLVKAELALLRVQALIELESGDTPYIFMLSVYLIHSQCI
jgi:hypothetical protein